MFYFDMIGTSEMPVCHSQGLKKNCWSLANFFLLFFFVCWVSVKAHFRHFIYLAV